MLGLAASLALRFPKLASFLQRYGKYLAIIGAVVGVYLAGSWYLERRDTANFNAGFSKAEVQFAAAVAAANAKAAETQRNLDLTQQRFAFLSEGRAQDIRLVTQPHIERITREVQSNPVYRQCVLTDGVLDATNAAGAAVNSRIAASQP